MRGSVMKLSVIGDEVGYDIQNQLEAIEYAGIKNIEIRKINDVNIVECSDTTIQKVIECVKGSIINVSMISTNIGKKSKCIDHVFRDFDRALNLAEILKCKYIRIFSDIEKSFDANIKCINNLINRAEKHNVLICFWGELNFSKSTH